MAKPDCSLACRHRQHQKGKHLAHQVAEMGGERHQIDVYSQQHQFDRHQDDDHVLPVQKDPEDADGKEMAATVR